MQKVETIPLALLLGPALTMGLTAVVMAAVAIINLMNGTSDMLTSAPTLVMSFSMLCGTLLWPLLTKHSEKKRRAEMEAERQKKYREYLNGVRDEIYKVGEEQKNTCLRIVQALRSARTGSSIVKVVFGNVFWGKMIF